MSIKMKEKLLAALLDLNCLQVRPKDPFTYASGLRGPLYCDNRLALSDPETRNLIAEMFVTKFNELKLKVDSVMGLATAGIAHGMLLADRLDLPFAYIRSKPKGHGKANLIEGKWREGMQVLLLEDLVNQGSSLSEAKLAIEKSGGVVVSSFCIVNYEFNQPEKAGDLHERISFTELVNYCETSSRLNKEELHLVRDWHAGLQK